MNTIPYAQIELVASAAILAFSAKCELWRLTGDIRDINSATADLGAQISRFGPSAFIVAARENSEISDPIRLAVIAECMRANWHLLPVSSDREEVARIINAASRTRYRHMRSVEGYLSRLLKIAEERDFDDETAALRYFGENFL